MLYNLYKNYLLKYPKIILLLMAVFVVVMALFAMRLEIDASAETLLLEDDKDLEFSRDVARRFETSSSLVITYTTQDDLLSQENIENIKELSTDIKTLNIVESINSIVNVPLLQSPPIPLKELLKDIPTLESKGVDKELVREEFLTSAVYKKNLVSEDFTTTALMINLKRDENYFSLINQREKYIKLKKEKNLSDEEKIAYKNIALEFKKYRDILREENHKTIADLRAIIVNFEKNHPKVKLHLGGIEMIADDMVEFVKYDLKTFGFIIVLLLIIILYILLREVKWVAISLLICTVSLIVTSGFLGLFGLEITVVSSNFISLQLIMNMSLVVHLVVRYKELLLETPNESQENLAIQSVLSMGKPSLFVVLTTIAGFSSLVFSGILPVINFGWMMSGGIVVSLIITYILFPITLLFLNKKEPKEQTEEELPFTSKIAQIAYSYKKSIIAITILVILFSISGATKLRVENSFIDYFKKDTQIYQGMALIDKKLGGTTPLDIILTFKEGNDGIKDIKVVSSDEDAELDSFSDEFKEQEGDKEQYWFTQNKMRKIKEVHEYLESLEAVGKVLSLSTAGEVLKVLNNNKEADGLTLALMYKKLPPEYKKIILSPYVDIENNQARISTRIIDSMPELKRDKLIKKIDFDLNNMLNKEFEEHKVSNLLVMYNSMLQSLYYSQIKTIGVVVVILFFMFLILFRSFKVALIAMIANIVPVGVVFGFMGWMNIPLDMMTITIAAISMGIAVDDTIHYIYRYSLLYRELKDAISSMFSAHKSIGSAMFYTSTIIIVGFSVLLFSNFFPTIYFGLLTMIAMFMAIVADLLLLPVLILLFGI
ncbi:Resistance-Nodulation-Cell Division Superfamily transporter [Sulfurimonas denitrificans DSM 1251]|uniref:Resistance-Nodulation-Cell Division Superfamily transporter n=1 Tax=Sulfurimonas denitrificans (strain ATCC 33889 / DSM 1251) TaxID=326298 RepID=Q30R22_SULDN|nr:MMPL family transporter [Sulfurimonas denitrificans]ABB44559.1 Resistance-Nodulation-Cell Division Superfamily transporter [Sulfurimonas denitrificans DSM 1251]